MHPRIDATMYLTPWVGSKNGLCSTVRSSAPTSSWARQPTHRARWVLPWPVCPRRRTRWGRRLRQTSPRAPRDPIPGLDPIDEREGPELVQPEADPDQPLGPPGAAHPPGRRHLRDHGRRWLERGPRVEQRAGVFNRRGDPRRLDRLGGTELLEGGSGVRGEPEPVPRILLEQAEQPRFEVRREH